MNPDSLDGDLRDALKLLESSSLKVMSEADRERSIEAARIRITAALTQLEAKP